MQSRVIAISRTVGAGAEEIGRGVAEELGFRYLDEDIVSAVAETHGLDPAVVADAEQRRPLVIRVLEDLATTQVSFGGFIGPSPADDGGRIVKSENVRALIRETIREAAVQGNVVILAHAASMALEDLDDVLRVLVTASPETRAERLATGGVSRDEAAKTVKTSDRARADYFKRFYQIEAELPVHYDVVLNTDRIPSSQASALVKAAAGG